MSKVTSAGILVKFGDRYVLGHASGQKHFDIFKGRMDEGEEWIDTALRECQEESGLIFVKEDLTLLGHNTYTKNKDLVVYIARIENFILESLGCTTFLESGLPEMDFFEVMDFEEMISKVGKSMSRVLSSYEEQIKGF